MVNDLKSVGQIGNQPRECSELTGPSMTLSIRDHPPNVALVTVSGLDQNVWLLCQSPLCKASHREAMEDLLLKGKDSVGYLKRC